MKVYITAPLAHNFQPEREEKLIEIVNFVDSILKEFKLQTYLTYRDFLQWGKVTYNPTTVFQKLDLELHEADIIIAVQPHEGVGCNITLGMASVLKKPLIILINKDFDMGSLPGLMYQGFKEMTKCEIIIYDDVQDLRKKLRQTIKNFMRTKK